MHLNFLKAWLLPQLQAISVVGHERIAIEVPIEISWTCENGLARCSVEGARLMHKSGHSKALSALNA
jgi:hypothetical protein